MSSLSILREVVQKLDEIEDLMGDYIEHVYSGDFPKHFDYAFTELEEVVKKRLASMEKAAYDTARSSAHSITIPQSGGGVGEVDHADRVGSDGSGDR